MAEDLDEEESFLCFAKNSSWDGPKMKGTATAIITVAMPTTSQAGAAGGFLDVTDASYSVALLSVRTFPASFFFFFDEPPIPRQNAQTEINSVPQPPLCSAVSYRYK